MGEKCEVGRRGTSEVATMMVIIMSLGEGEIDHMHLFI